MEDAMANQLIVEAMLEHMDAPAIFNFLEAFKDTALVPKLR